MSVSTPTIQVVAYYRQSVCFQNAGLLIQQQRVRQWAKRHHVQIVREFVDAEQLSFGAPVVPAFAQMMEWLNQREDVRFVLCLDHTRLRRFPGQAAIVTDAGNQVISVATTHFSPFSPPVLDP